MSRYTVLAAVFFSILALPAWGAETVITQKNKKFLPNEVTIKVGDTLTFVNAEKRHRHNVYTQNEKFRYVKAKIQKPGQQNSIVVNDAGSFKIECALHPRMSLMVTVTQ